MAGRNEKSIDSLEDIMDGFSRTCPQRKICGDYPLCMKGMGIYKCVVLSPNLEWEGGYDVNSEA